MITFIFNMLILGLTGSTGVAAYGVVANMSLVGMAITNGMAQGTQPLISESFGKGEHGQVKKLLRWALTSVIVVEVAMVILVWIFTDPFVAAFNSENNLLLLKYAHTGLRLYFLGFLFAGVNIMLVAYLFSNCKCTSGDHRITASRCCCNRSLCDCARKAFRNEWCLAVIPGICRCSPLWSS